MQRRVRQVCGEIVGLSTIYHQMGSPVGHDNEKRVYADIFKSEKEKISE